MLISTSSVAAVFVAVIGALILWSNPGRAVNRVIFTCSLHIAIWLALLHVAAYVFRQMDAGVVFLRLNCAVGAAVPLHFWLVKECLATGEDTIDWKRLRRGITWILITLALAALCFTDFFIPFSSNAQHRLRGPGYYIYMFADLALYGALFRDMFKTAQRLNGARRLEVQVWLGGGCAMTSAIVITMALNALTRDPLYIRLQPVFTMLFYAATAYAITTHRIFDASQILRLGVNRIALAVIVTTVSFGTYRVFSSFLPMAVAFIPTTLVTLIAAAWVGRWLDERFQYYPQATAARQEAFVVASRESRGDKLESGFLKILKGWGQTDHAILLSGGGNEPLRGSGMEIPADCQVMQTLRQLRWITPERLAREKATPERTQLAEFLGKHRLGVAILEEGPILLVLVGVGVAASRRPFTYPQVTQLRELGSIFGNALERARLTEKVQHAEQLATVGLLGASLAHEIRNPLVTIKTFVQLLPSRHQDPTFREKFFRLMSEEVARIDRLTEQLLELASPRAYSAQLIGLHAVLEASLELVSPKAADKRVQLLTAFDASPDVAFTDPSAVKQVVLNLCLNGIQASEARAGERWIKIGTRNRQGGVEMSVSDCGTGIAPEIRSRLFRPFQTTKSSGFGLGLAICRDILTGLNAGIEVDPPETGQGATFRGDVSMPTIVVLATADGDLAAAWERQLPPGRTAVRLGAQDFPGGTAVGFAAVVVLDAAAERLLPAALGRCPTLFVGEPKSLPFEQARMAGRAKAYVSYEESVTRLRDFLPLLEELAEKQSMFDMMVEVNRRPEPAARMGRMPPADDAADWWDFFEGVVENLESRDRLITEFRRASRHLLHASHTVFFLREPDGFRADRGTSFFPVDDPIVSFFEEHPAIIDSSVWEVKADPVAELAVRNRLALWGARVLVPVHDNGRLLGLIALGVRDDGQPYDETDRSRSVFFARLLRLCLAKAGQLGRLSTLTEKNMLGAKYLPSTLVLGPDESAPRHVPLVVRDLIGQAQRGKQACRVGPSEGQPFRAAAGPVSETGGTWATWDEASGEVHDAAARQRVSRRGLLREIGLTLSHEVGNALVSLAMLRQFSAEKAPPAPLLETALGDVAKLESLNRQLGVMQTLHEADAMVVDLRDLAQSIGQSLQLRVEVGPDPVRLSVARDLVDFAVRSLIESVAENRPDHGMRDLVLQIRSTGEGAKQTALLSIKGRHLELEGILPEPLDTSVPSQGRLGVFLAKEILRLHHGDIHAGPGMEGTEILISLRSL